MNRNSYTHFSTVPSMNHQRSTFDRSYSHTTSFDFGDLIPIMVEEVLPGDTLTLDTAMVARLQTMLAPVYSNMYLDTYFFFVPSRLTWTHWKEFMGENTQSAWAQTVEYTVPVTIPPTGGWQKGTIADYMGLPLGINLTATDDRAPISLPLRAYAMICNEFFRDQNLTDPLNIPVTDQATIGSNGDNYLTDVVKGGKPFKASRFHDMFSSCLPAPQKGPNVRVPIVGDLPVFAGKLHTFRSANAPYDQNYMAFNTGDRSSERTNIYDLHLGTAQSSYSDVIVGSDLGSWTSGNFPPAISTPVNRRLYPANLWAGTTSASGTPFAGIDISALRLATVTQMYYEALARSGSRLEEQIQQFFGVTNPDSRVQHPEYLGGNRIAINVHEVTNTAQTDVDFLGDVGAQSVTSNRSSSFTKSFTENGYVIGVCVARYDHIYGQGLDRMWTRKHKFDYYNPMFARIGEQPIYRYEIYAKGDDATSIFGYNEAWVQYRVGHNRVSGELRADVSGNLSHWTLADNYDSAPYLSDGWIREDKRNVDRALAVTSSVSNQLFADFYFSARWSRVMPMYSVPGMVGQF